VSVASLPPWLDAPFARFRDAFDAGRLAHAVLVQGPPGWGQADLARAVTLVLLGRTDVAADLDLSQLAHPDLRWVLPEGAGEQIRIGTVREIGEFTAQTPQIAPRKVVVLNPADALNEHAANALLKTLEEPAGASHLLLVTEAVADLLPTIRSRCWHIDIRPVARASVLEWLARVLPDRDAGALAALAFEHGYAPHRVRQALERGDEPLAPALAAVVEGRIAPVAAAQRLLSVPVDDFVARSMRYVATAMARADAAAAALPAPLRRIDPTRLWVLWQAHLDARRATLGTTNPNPQLLVEGILFGWRRAAAAGEAA
jgi:DNA polymerase-3 subunit delta'